MLTDVSEDQPYCGLSLYKAPAYSKKTILHRLWSWFRYLVKAGHLVWKYSSLPLLFIVAQPPYLPILGWLRNILVGQSYVVWVDDVYPDVIARHGKLKENNWILKIWRHLNRLMLKGASRVFTLGPCMAHVLAPYLSTSEDKPGVSVVPTWVDTERIKPTLCATIGETTWVPKLVYN